MPIWVGAPGCCARRTEIAPSLRRASASAHASAVLEALLMLARQLPDPPPLVVAVRPIPDSSLVVELVAVELLAATLAVQRSRVELLAVPPAASLLE